MLTFRSLDAGTLDEAALLMASEQAAAHAVQSRLPVAYTDPRLCRVSLEDLLAAGHIGCVASDGHACAGVMCARIIGSVGFLPAHGLAVDPDLVDATPVVVGLLGELAPSLLRDGAEWFAVDHVDLKPLGEALNNAAFGRWSVFANQPARPTESPLDVEVRVGTSDDLDAIAALSQIELAHRFTAPIYSHPQPRTLAAAAPSTSDS